MLHVGRFLFLGGFEETIKIYDVRKKREVGLLEGHGGTITVLKHHDGFIFSGSEDKTIKVWKMKDWALIDTLQLTEVIGQYISQKIDYSRSRYPPVWETDDIVDQGLETSDLEPPQPLENILEEIPITYQFHLAFM